MHNSVNIARLAVSFMLICWTSLAAAQPTRLAVGYSGISACETGVDRFVEELDKSGYIDNLYGQKK
jgi:hypothetical protein